MTTQNALAPKAQSWAQRALNKPVIITVDMDVDGEKREVEFELTRPATWKGLQSINQKAATLRTEGATEEVLAHEQLSLVVSDVRGLPDFAPRLEESLEAFRGRFREYFDGCDLLLIAIYLQYDGGLLPSARRATFQ